MTEHPATKPESESDNTIKKLVQLYSKQNVQKSDELDKTTRMQYILNSLVNLTLLDIPFDEMLSLFLEECLSIPWLPIESKGSIHLVGKNPDVLVLRAEKGMTEEQRNVCGRIPMGHCICGRTAASGNVLFAPHMDELHDVRIEGMDDHGEYCVPIVSGKDMWGVLNLRVLKGCEWNPRHSEYMESITDILSGAIERHLSKKEILKLSNAVQQSADIIFITDREGNIEYVNPAFEKITGYSAEDAIGKTPRILRSGEMSKDYYTKVWSTILSGEVIRAHVVNRRKDGSRFYYDQTITPMTDDNGEIIEFISTGKDITDKINAEKALRASEKKYSTLVEESNDGIIIIQDGVIRFVNSKMAEMTGDDRDEAIGNPFTDYIDPAFMEDVVARYKSRIDGNEVVNRYEIEILSEKGKKIPVEINANVINYDGKPAVMAIVRDISKRRKSEMERERLIDELRATNRELRDTQIKLVQSEKLAGMGTMAAGVAHEINNPLQIIIGMSEMIMDEDDMDQIRSDAGEVLDATERIRRIVSNLTRYSRDVKTLDTASVHMNVVIGKSLEIARFSAKFRSIDINTELGDLPPIVANHGELEQVFINLITNAVQAMEGKGKLDIRTAFEDGNICVCVADEGPGISGEDINKIYDPFFTTKDVGEGTGLGLYIVYTIVTKYRGTVDVDSEEGKGTTFTIRFPVDLISDE